MFLLVFLRWSHSIDATRVLSRQHWRAIPKLPVNLPSMLSRVKVCRDQAFRKPGGLLLTAYPVDAGFFVVLVSCRALHATRTDFKMRGDHDPCFLVSLTPKRLKGVTTAIARNRNVYSSRSLNLYRPVVAPLPKRLSRFTRWARVCVIRNVSDIRHTASPRVVISVLVYSNLATHKGAHCAAIYLSASGVHLYLDPPQRTQPLLRDAPSSKSLQIWSRSVRVFWI